MKTRILLVSLPLAGVLLAACDDHNDNCCDAVYVTPGGLYSGTLTDSSASGDRNVYVIVDENGNGRMIDSDYGDYYRLALSNNNFSLSGSFTAFAGSTPFPNNQTTVTGSVSGQITQDGITASFTESNGVTGTLNLVFSNYYYQTSSLSLLSGSWSYSDTTSGYSLSLSINGDGSFSGSDTDGCTYTGNFSIFDPDFDAYHLSYTDSCASGSTFTGLAAYYPQDNQGGEQIEILADDNNGQFIALPVDPPGAAARSGSASSKARPPVLVKRSVLTH